MENYYCILVHIRICLQDCRHPHYLYVMPSTISIQKQFSSRSFHCIALCYLISRVDVYISIRVPCDIVSVQTSTMISELFIIHNGCCDGLPNHLISENRRVVSIIVLSFVIWFKVSLNCVLFQQGHDIFVC